MLVSFDSILRAQEFQHKKPPIIMMGGRDQDVIDSGRFELPGRAVSRFEVVQEQSTRITAWSRAFDDNIVDIPTAELP